MERSHSRYGQTDVWDKIWRDRRGRVVLFQMPNMWLIAWAVLDILSIFTNGTFSNIVWWLATVILGIWAILEILQGVNYFRRGLGVVVLIFVLMSVFKVGL